ncbi:MAG: hypothetical protein AAFV62_11715, partial [Pseudomonadota bacterium]
MDTDSARLFCEFDQLGPTRLSGRCGVRDDAGARVVMTVEGEAGTMLSRRLRSDAMAPGNPFDVFIPRGSPWLTVRALCAAGEFVARLEMRDGGLYTVVAQETVAVGRDGEGSLRTLAEGLAAEAETRFHVDQAMLEGGPAKELMQQAYDALVDLRPDSVPVHLLTEYLDQFGPHQYFCEKLSFLLLRMRALES